MTLLLAYLFLYEGGYAWYWYFGFAIVWVARIGVLGFFPTRDFET